MNGKLLSAYILILFSLSFGCLQNTGENPAKGPILLATTTSTYDSGLLDHILPGFEEKYGIKVRVIPVGTGQALEIGRRGDADVILVHSPPDEERFIAEGYGTERRCVMYNDFVIVGPKDDPARIKDDSVEKAFIRLPSSGSVFISRGDGSGTHKKEILLWNKSGVYPSGAWYLETGTGMGQTLLTANEIRAYTLTDRGTFVSMKKNLNLSILVAEDKALLNPYGIIAVNPEKNPGVNNAGAELFIQWITSSEGQKLIEGFKKDGERLFIPLHGKCVEET